MFELTKNETLSLRSQFATSNKDGIRGGNRYSPFAFTENGVAMLSSVLKSDTTMPNRSAAKLDIAASLLDAAIWNSTIVGADDGANQLAEYREDFSNKIP